MNKSDASKLCGCRLYCLYCCVGAGCTGAEGQLALRLVRELANSGEKVVAGKQG